MLVEFYHFVSFPSGKKNIDEKNDRIQAFSVVKFRVTRGAPWVSGLVGHFVQTWPDSECSHTVQFLDCSDLN